MLAVEHHLVDDLLNEFRAVDRVRLDGADLGSCAPGIYFVFTPYCERAFSRQHAGGVERAANRPCSGSPADP